MCEWIEVHLSSRTWHWDGHWQCRWTYYSDSSLWQVSVLLIFCFYSTDQSSSNFVLIKAPGRWKEQSWRNSNWRTAMEWWKPGIKLMQCLVCCRDLIHKFKMDFILNRSMACVLMVKWVTSTVYDKCVSWATGLQRSQEGCLTCKKTWCGNPARFSRGGIDHPWINSWKVGRL